MVLTLYIYIYIYRKGERVRAEIKWNNEVITGSIIPDYSQTSYVTMLVDSISSLLCTRLKTLHITQK
jgi:hypothetical protein